MENIDEKIAKLKLQARVNQEEEEKDNIEQELNINKEKKTLEEVIEEMKEGVVTFEERSFEFKNQSYLNGKIEIPIPEKFFEESGRTATNIGLLNETYGISFTATFIEKGAVKQSFKQFKAGMERQFKTAELYLEWLEEGELIKGKSKVYYASYKTPTGKGDTYNLIFFRENKGTLIIGNYNCFYKEIEIWELLIKASINLMRIK
jgi:hypothetical protein